MKPLPPPQQQTITILDGLPGSGKTQALVMEACRLVNEEGYAPSQTLILAMTPLNKKRLEHYMETAAEGIGVSGKAFPIFTVDEWLFKTLQEQANDEGKALLRLSETETRLLLQELLRQHIPTEHPFAHASRNPSFARAFWDLFRQWQVQGITPASLQAHYLTPQPNGQTPAQAHLAFLAELYQTFLAQTHEANLLNPAEAANRLYSRLMENPGVLAHLQERYPVILIDEAQELSATQHHILTSLPTHLVLTGTFTLRVRSFRGAHPEHWATWLPKNPHAQIQTLNQCQRKNHAVVSLIAHQFYPALKAAISAKPHPAIPDGTQMTENNHQTDLSQRISSGYPLQAIHQETREGLRPECISLNAYFDPEREAMAMAEAIEQFVTTGRVDARPAKWQDCVILLRSSRFKPYLIDALLQRSIPFQDNRLSEALIPIQHQLYDFFQILAYLEQLCIPASLLDNAQTLKRHLATTTLSASVSVDIYQRFNRHLRRWLDESVALSENTTFLRELAVDESMQNPDSLFLLWIDILEKAPGSEILSALSRIAQAYQQYQENLSDKTASWLALWDDICQEILAHGTDMAASATIQASLHEVREDLRRLDTHYQALFQTPLGLHDFLHHYADWWENLDIEEHANTGELVNRVRLLSYHQAQGEEFPWVGLPFLVADEFPRVRTRPELLLQESEATPADASTTSTPPVPWSGLELAKTDEAEEKRLLALGMTRATQHLILSTHRSEEGVPVQTSPFYETLQHTWQTIAAPQNEANTIATNDTLNAEEEGSTSAIYTRYSGNTAWSQLPNQVEEPLFSPSDVLNISASAIKTYMSCPRQFYYQNLLGLRTPQNQSAAMGTMIHRIMEVFNTHTPPHEATAERLRALTLQWFEAGDSDTVADSDAFLNAGFTQKDAQQIASINPLTRVTWRQRLLDSIDDLEKKGYFQRYQGSLKIEAEKRLSDIQLEGLDRCRFKGTLDALIQLHDGSWELLDYKTFHTAYGTSLDRCELNFRSTLDPLPDEDDLSHAERFAEKLHPVYPKDYQLPLYYLACNNDPAYQRNIRSVALQLIRPTFPDKPEQGSIRLELSRDELEAAKTQLIEDLRRFIIEPILDSKTFRPNAQSSTCGYCGYFNICESAQTSGDEESEAAS